MAAINDFFFTTDIRRETRRQSVYFQTIKGAPHQKVLFPFGAGCSYIILIHHHISNYFEGLVIYMFDCLKKKCIPIAVSERKNYRSLIAKPHDVLYRPTFIITGSYDNWTVVNFSTTLIKFPFTFLIVPTNMNIFSSKY